MKRAIRIASVFLFVAVVAAVAGGVDAIVSRDHPQSANSTTANSTTTTTAQDIQTVQQRRISTIVGATTGVSSIPSWLSTLGTNGKWPDSEIDYTSGCTAQTANWPAEDHWSRILTLAAAWHGGVKNANQWVNNPVLRQNISLAMGYWFENDFTDPSCLDSGGDPACPCGTPGFWNTNWFSNIIGIPASVGQVCLLLNTTLLLTELGNCTHITGRSYNTFVTGINGVNPITGANLLDIASIGIDGGLLVANATQITGAYGRVHNEVVIQNATKADGIRADGSFGQHSGIIYNGNYGKDYANDVIDLEIEAGGTQFQATNGSKDAFAVLLDGDKWMIYRNVLTNVLHWDFSVVGRMISFAVADDQATEDTKLNFTQIQQLGQEWNSQPILDVYDAFTLNTTDANSGNLRGNKVFYNNDYFVQRGAGYVTTLRMFSTRTRNTECINTQNPFGFHLSDGTVYTHLQGNEYEDIAAAWDWNLIPGITVDYDATPLTCSGTGASGTQTFVGAASDGERAVVAMRYETPSTKTLNWRKTWFFLDNDVQFAMIARINSTTSAPVFSVLDQRRHDGDVYVNGAVSGTGNYTKPSSLWHGGVGYTFNSSNTAASLSVQLGDRSGNWAALGISTQGPETVDLFAAWLSHSDLTAPVSYAVYPATTLASFQQKSSSSNLQVARNDGSVSALLDVTNQVAMLVFWEAAGGTVTVPSASGGAPVTVQSNGSSNIIIHTDTWDITLCDPTQTLTSVSLDLTLGTGSAPNGWGSSSSKTISFSLPIGGQAGDSVTQSLLV